MAQEEVKTGNTDQRDPGEKNVSIEFLRMVKNWLKGNGVGGRHLRQRKPQEHRTKIRNTLQGISSILPECREHCRERWETELQDQCG